MTNLHHRHANTRKREQVSLRFFQNRQGHGCRAGAEVKDSFSHLLSPQAVSGYFFSPCCDLNIVPALRKTRDRRARRSVSTMNKFVQPEITELFPRANARNATSTTSSAVCDTRAGGLFILEASKKFVS